MIPILKKLSGGKTTNKAVIQNLILGQVGTNCLLIKNSETGEMLIVDPADSAGTISQAVTKLNGNPAAVLLTHGHFDHILAVDDLRDLYEIPVYAYEKEQDVLEDSRSESLSRLGSCVYDEGRCIREG